MKKLNQKLTGIALLLLLAGIAPLAAAENPGDKHGRTDTDSDSDAEQPAPQQRRRVTRSMTVAAPVAASSSALAVPVPAPVVTVVDEVECLVCREPMIGLSAQLRDNPALCDNPTDATTGFRRLPCGHCFDTACVEQWGNINPTCPACRAPFNLLNPPAAPVVPLAMPVVIIQDILFIACLMNNQPLVTFLLANGADVSIPSPSGSFPLYYAQFNNNLAMMEMLLTHPGGAAANIINHVDYNEFPRETPLMRAVNDDTLEIVNLLLAHGADATIIAPHSRNALQRAQDNNNLEMMRVLLANPRVVAANVVNQPLADALNDTLLIRAIDAGNHAMVAMLLDNGADANLAGRFGYTPLQRARSNPAMMLLLLQHGAQVNQPDSYGDTVLSVAIINDDHAMVTMLLDNGADVTLSLGDYYGTPLQRAQSTNDVALFTLILEHPRVPADFLVNRAYANGYTPLAYACKKGNRAMVELLLAHGANPVLAGPNLETPLFAAQGDAQRNHYVGIGDLQIMRILLQYPAVKAQLNRPFANEVLAFGFHTPLTYALLMNRHLDGDEMISFLLEQGADPSLPRPGGQTPLEMARFIESRQLIKNALAAKAAREAAEDAEIRDSGAWCVIQ